MTHTTCGSTTHRRLEGGAHREELGHQALLLVETSLLGAEVLHSGSNLAQIIFDLGKLRDRRAVPVLIKHLPEVQNRREMVEALGEIGDPAAAEALLARLRSDEYVPVRIAAAKALARLGDAHLAAPVDEAARKEKEATVAAAARAAAAALRGK